ncbi:MAG TPA: DinB family protein [Ktedonobacterales bacterium]|nr:DinB family protein [Ktedonobacterales bacterium]
MSATNPTLAILTQGWQTYQERLAQALAPLTLEQVTLRAAPNLRSIDQLARHIIGVRAAWFHNALGIGDDDFAAYSAWNDAEVAPRPGAELAAGLTATWAVVQTALDGFTPEYMEETFERERWGKKHTLIRGWVVWHVIEHDLHHGGELGYSLGMHGLAAPDI